MRRADRREQLLTIARQLVAQEGASALTMTALSELASVAKPVVYSHFSNSEDVAIELLDQHFRQLTDAVRSRIASARSLVDYISWMVDASFEFENASDIPVRKITNGFSASKAVNEAFLRHEEEFRGNWETLLRHCGVSEDVIDVAALAMSGMVSNLVYTYSLKPQQRKARETLKGLLLGSIETLAPGARDMIWTDFLPGAMSDSGTSKDEAPATAAPRKTARRPKRVAADADSIQSTAG